MALLALIASSLALVQSQVQDIQRVANPDFIYFGDGRYPLNLQTANQRPSNLHTRFEEQQPDQGVRLPVNMIPQIGQYPNINGENQNIYGQNPNVDGQGPSINGQSSNINGQNPNMNDQNPNIAGLNPNMNGQNPNIAGLNPNMNGQNSNFNGLNPNINGLNQNINGQYPNINGQYPNIGIMNTNVNPLKRPSPELEPPQDPNRDVLLADQPETANRFSDADDSVPSGRQPAGVNATFGPVVPKVDKVSLGVSQFGIDLLKIIQRQPGNRVVSPYSIGTLLALLQQGALGATQQQISNALRLNPGEAADGFKRLSENLQKRRSNNIFTVGNGLFIADAFSVNPAFKRVAIRDFGSEVTPMKFSRPEQAAAKINSWIASKTNDKITSLVAPESVGESTQLALVNAVYFKGLWAVKFRPESTLPKDFHLSNGSKKTVNFMRMRRFLRAEFDPSIGSQFLVLPFEGGQYSLVIVLPSESGTVASALSALTPEKLLSYQNYPPMEIALSLPKFTIKSDTNLVNVFQQMGIINIFGPTSDLSGLGNYREFAPQVSSAVHSALLSIDEQGGTASAATSFGVVALSYDDSSVAFDVNRPFIAVLWDKETSLPLFMAKIEDPVQ